MDKNDKMLGPNSKETVYIGNKLSNILQTVLSLFISKGIILLKMNYEQLY